MTIGGKGDELREEADKSEEKSSELRDAAEKHDQADKAEDKAKEAE